MERKIEILAPAGGFESVIAAVRNGADAVYVGEKDFSARASAHNFDGEELCRAISYSHIHGVKVYVAINTIVFDDEFERLKKAIEAAARADADALIVQNMGAARLARQIAPDLRLHASTQMSVHTYCGVKALYEMGFSRVVLSREMTAKEIEKAAGIPVELEVFVHGALCMSVSGQCYFSAMLGSRSGNRGACAQPCRLPFSAENQRNGHALSLKDNSIISYLSQLEQMGVASAKIEGRMKRPEYVAAAVRACREQIDLGFVSGETASLLRNVFSRTGFTDGYYTDSKGKAMFGTRTKDDVISADGELFSKIRQTYKDEVRNVPIDGYFTAEIGKKPMLEVSDGEHKAVCTADFVCESAQKIALNSEKCRAQLEKTGGTAYIFKNLRINIEDGLSMPLSVLNALRRETLEKLDGMRAKIHNYTVNKVDTAVKSVPPKKFSGTRARTLTTKLSPAFRDCELVYVPLFADINEISRLMSENYPVAVEIPRGMFGREESIIKRLEAVREIGIRHTLCGNIGAVYIAKQLGFTVHGGFGLNLCNTQDLLWAEEYGIADVELSFELTFERINALGGGIPRGIITYGCLPLMLTANCPNKSAGISCKSCKNNSKLTDRRGEKFYLKCDGSCVEVLNCVPLFVAEKEFSTLSANFNILRFSVENYVENVENIRDFNPKPMLKDRFTRGLYLRGVK